ncbi:MAG TPA: hypothetical protein VD906_06355, partial [Caulobacteraceae bacterium]|nr:hypothetical protein [Caulobacteraceae bacterium]
MRPQLLIILAALAAPGVAAAQGATGHPMMDVGQVLRQAEQPLTQWAPPPSLLVKLRRDSRDWIREETRRQVETPREPLDLLLAADKAIGKDVAKLSRRIRIAPQEILTGVVLKIVIEAEAEVANLPRGAERDARLE